MNQKNYELAAAARDREVKIIELLPSIDDVKSMKKLLIASTQPPSGKNWSMIGIESDEPTGDMYEEGNLIWNGEKTEATWVRQDGGHWRRYLERDYPFFEKQDASDSPQKSPMDKAWEEWEDMMSQANNKWTSSFERDKAKAMFNIGWEKAEKHFTKQ